MAWARAYIQKYWTEARAKAAAEEKKKKEEEEARNRKGVRGTISGMFINVTILPPDGGLRTGMADLKFRATECIPPSLSLDTQDLQNYQLSQMRKAMDRAWVWVPRKESLPLPPWVSENGFNAKHGELIYQRRKDSAKPVKRDHQFQTALLELHRNRRDDDDVLQFYFHLETENEKKVREAREGAAKRSRDAEFAEREKKAREHGAEMGMREGTPLVQRLVRDSSISRKVKRKQEGLREKQKEGRMVLSEKEQLEERRRHNGPPSAQVPREESSPQVKVPRLRPASQQQVTRLPVSAASSNRRPISHQPAPHPSSQTTRPTSSPPLAQNPPSTTNPPSSRKSLVEPKRFVPIHHLPLPPRKPAPAPQLPGQEDSKWSEEGSFKTETSSENGRVTKLKREVKRASGVIGGAVKDVVDLAVRPREKAMGYVFFPFFSLPSFPFPFLMGFLADMVMALGVQSTHVR